MYGSCPKQATVNKLTMTKYTLRDIRHILILTVEYLLYKWISRCNKSYTWPQQTVNEINIVLTCLCHAIYIKQRHVGAGVSHYWRCVTQRDIVTGLCHRFGMWCVRCHRFMSQVWHVVRQMSQVYVTGFVENSNEVTWHSYPWLELSLLRCTEWILGCLCLCSYHWSSLSLSYSHGERDFL